MINKLLKRKTISISTKETKLIRYTPLNYSESRMISKELLKGNVVVVDVEKMPKHDIIRLIDFVSGTLLAIDGDYKKLAPFTFLLAPSKKLAEKYEKELIK